MRIILTKEASKCIIKDYKVISPVNYKGNNIKFKVVKGMVNLITNISNESIYYYHDWRHMNLLQYTQVSFSSDDAEIELERY